MNGKPLLWCSRNGYYPFGMGMPGRKFAATSEYRYGFNGKENDKDMHSTTWQDYGFRIYSPALGKFLSEDPLTKKYPWYTPYQFAGNMPIKYIDLDGCEPAENPKSDGAKEKVAKATVFTILKKASDKNFQDNLFDRGTWTGETIKGTFSCSSKQLVKGGQTKSTNNQTFVSDNTDNNTPATLNIWVSGSAMFNVDESNSKNFTNYEVFVVNELLAKFISGNGPENYSFPTNGIISSKFYNSDIFKEALSEYNSGKLKPNETKQYGFGLNELCKDALRNWSLFSITGFAGSGTILFSPTAEGVKVTIFNITSLSSGALIKNPNDITTFPKSYVRDNSSGQKTTTYGNISQTFNLFIPFGSDLLKSGK